MSEVVPAQRLQPAETAFRVLVVDDDPDMAAYLARLLANEGLVAETVHSGDAAMVYVMATPPDLVLLDVMMPGSDGFAICERLKADAATAMIPVVLVTALEDQQSRVRGIRAGADDFLSKPVHREELVARVTTLRRLHTTRRELESRLTEALPWLVLRHALDLNWEWLVERAKVHDAQNRLGSWQGQGNGHIPGQLSIVLPLIDLWLVVNQTGPVLLDFPGPSWVGSSAACCGC
jgi:CheY-like chemotaxis protein